MLKAYDEKTGLEVNPGDTVTDFRGEKCTFVQATRERTWKSGKVVVRLPQGLSYEYYDKVFNLIVKEVEDVKEPSAGMSWAQLNSTEWYAKGKDGMFLIERRGDKFWAHYYSEDCAFKMPPKSKLSEAKEMCENNEYWEYAV